MKDDDGYTPDSLVAAEICWQLMEASMPVPDDPEGRTLSLGVCMFVGVFLSAASLKDRELFLKAAMGMSFQTEDILKDVLRAIRKSSPPHRSDGTQQ